MTGTSEWLPWRVGNVIIATTGTVVALIAIGAYYLWPLDRSIFIEADSEEIEITLAADTVWRVSGAILCRRGTPTRGQSPSPATGSSAEASGAPPDCGSAEEAFASNLTEVRWQSGSRLTFRRQRQASPTISILNPNQSIAIAREPHALQPGDRIILVDDFRQLHAIGATTLGGSSESGPILVSGSYEWRERLPFRKRPDLVDSGSLRSGDWVFVGRGSCEKPEIGDVLIMPAATDEDAARVVYGVGDKNQESSTKLGLCLWRHGFGKTFIEPNLVGRIISDPVIFGLGLIVTLLATVFPAVLGLSEFGRRAYFEQSSEKNELERDEPRAEDVKKPIDGASVLGREPHDLE